MTATIENPATPPAAPPPQSSKRRWLRRLHIALLIVALGAGVLLSVDAAAGIVALFVLVVPFEKLFQRHPYHLRRPGLRTDLTYALIAPVLNLVALFVGIGIALVVFPVWLPALLLRPIVTGQPSWALAVEAVVLLDLLIYFAHRLGHEVGFFWRFHSIHHSSERMDWISGVRQHPFDGIIIAVPFAVLVAAGFNFELVGVAAFAQIIVGLFAHANVRWRLRPLHRIIMTPEFHHWHHANYPESIHSNYSVFLPIWDIIFGTYYMPKHTRPKRYGTDDPIPPSVPAQLLYPLRHETRLRYPFKGHR